MTKLQEISIWMIEDDTDFGEAFSAVFNLSPLMSCKRVFSSCEDAFSHVRSDAYASDPDAAPHVVLLDINLPGTSGIEGIETLKQLLPSSRIVMLTIRDEPETIFEAFRRGASGYLPKNAPVDEILAAVTEAYRGGTLMPAPVARRVLALLQSAPANDYDLSSRETDVLREMTSGKSQQAIADTLFVSRHTINTHIQHIYEKLHVHSGIEAVVKALRERLV